MNYINSTYILIFNCFFLVLIFLSLIISIKNKSDYFRYGPNKTLTLINIKIDDWNKYILLITFLIFFRLSYIVTKRIGNKYIDNKNKYINTFLSNTMYFTRSLSFLILVKIFVTQFDFALITIFISELLFSIISFIITKLNYTNIDSYNTNLLDVTHINPLFEAPRLEFRNQKSEIINK